MLKKTLKTLYRWTIPIISVIAIIFFLTKINNNPRIETNTLATGPIYSGISANLSNEYYVEDYANVISDDIQQKLELYLTEKAKEKNIHIRIITITSLENYAITPKIEDLAKKELDKWKPQEKNKIIILTAVNQRQIRIEISPESPITTRQAEDILDIKIIPELKNNNWSKAMILGSEALINSI